MNQEVKIGVIGLGNMGRTHAQRILDGDVPGMKLAAVADEIEEKSSLFSGIPFYNTGEALIESGEVDAVLVATPHYSHTTLGVAALEAGLHLLVEKPISVHKKDCETLIAAAEGRKQVFAAMFNQRTDPSYQRLKSLIDNGELGSIRRIQWTITNWFRSETYYASGGWRATWAGEGGGVLLNQCPHQLDLWQWLFGMPDSIWADCEFGAFHDIEVEDRVTAVMKYGNGARGILVTTTGEAPGSNRLEIACDRGKLVLEGNKIHWTRSEVNVSEFTKESKSGFGLPPFWDVDISVQGQGEQHLGVMKNFCQAILKGEPLIAPAEEGIRSVELANAMLLSAFTKREIELPMNSDEYAGELMKRIEASKPKKEKLAVSVSADDFAKSF